MKRNYQYLLKNVGILTISNFSSKILVFMLVPLYTSILSTSEYGTYDLVFSTIQLLFPILTLNIADAVMRFCMDKAADQSAVIQVGIRYVVASYFLSAFTIVLWNQVSGFFAIKNYSFVIWLYFITYVSNQFMIQLAKGTEKILDMGIAGVASTIALLVGNILFLIFFQWSLLGFFAANILSQFLSAAYLGIRLKIWKYCFSAHKDNFLHKEMLAYCLPLIFTTIGWWVNNASDKYVVAFLCGTAANGLLSVAYKIPNILNTLQGVFIQAWQVSAIKEYSGKKATVFYSRTYRYLNLMMCGTASVLILLARPIASILYAKDFYEAWQYVPFLLISCVLNSASGFLGPILTAAKDSKSMAKSAIYGASTNFVLNILLVLAIGPQGAVIATAISSYIIFLIRRKAVGAQIKLSDAWKDHVSWILLCMQAILSIYQVFWITELIVLLVLVILNYTTIRVIASEFFLLFLKPSRADNINN